MRISRLAALIVMPLSLGGTASADQEPDELLPGKLVLVRPGDLVRFVGRDAVTLPAAANDPTVVGATLSVFDTAYGGAGEFTAVLPAAGWKALGSPAGSRGFRYRGDPTDACRTVLLKPTVLKAKCRGSAIGLAPPFGGEVGVVLTVGADAKRYCASSGGIERRNDAVATKRIKAPAPGSCPTTVLGTHDCSVLSGGPGNFMPSLFFKTGLYQLDLVASGAIRVSCGSPDADGAAPCSCEIVDFGAFHIPEIADICLYPAGPCPGGTLDCDGGETADADFVAEHDIGACADNASCAVACSAFCGGLGATHGAQASGCEGLCQGGSADENPCTAQSQCPGGSCVGGNAGAPPHPGRCNCQCSGVGLGTPAPAGTLTCSLGMRWTMEIPTDGQCGNGSAVIDSGPLCVPLTTATSVSVLNDANGVAGVTIPAAGPETRGGAPLSCAAFGAGTLSGLQLVGGATAVFDTVFTGDILTTAAFSCQ